MRRYGLIGFPLGHSFSKSYFEAKFQRENRSDCRFENFPLEDIQDFHQVIKHYPDLAGLAVTIPHKTSVIPFLSELDSDAAAMGAVNCLKPTPQGWKGFNTDWIGFRDSFLAELGPEHKKALVFGTGGSSKAIVYALQQLGITYQLVSRKSGPGLITYEDLTHPDWQEYLVWINCTPTGTYPNIHAALPLPFDQLTSRHYLYDLVYNPPRTVFLEHGLKVGARVRNGQDMLIIQAEFNWKIWNQD